jgi:hypothetical protein
VCTILIECSLFECHSSNHLAFYRKEGIPGK